VVGCGECRFWSYRGDGGGRGVWDEGVCEAGGIREGVWMGAFKGEVVGSRHA